jgi:hypothetical protein
MQPANHGTCPDFLELFLVYIWHSTFNNNFNCAKKIFKLHCLFSDELGPPRTDRYIQVTQFIVLIACATMPQV